MDPALQELIRSDLDQDDQVEVVVRLKDPRLLPKKLKMVTQFGNIVTCRIRRGDIKETYHSPWVKSFKASKYVVDEPLLRYHSADRSETLLPVLSRQNSTLPSGKGVVVGVIDWGIDFAHPNFRDADGGSRLLGLWDQSQTWDPMTQPYGYGRCYLKQEINQALASKQPYRALRYHPAKGDPRNTGAHGTHVMDIAAGNGSVGYMGVAPAADLVFVHLAAKGTGPLANLGDSVRILEAIDFVSRLANDRPLVINLSVGRHGGHHRGTSLVEQGMDRFLEQRRNTVICQSTGNYYKAQAHTSGIVRPGRAQEFFFWNDQADRTPNELEVWYPGSDQFIFELHHPEIPVGWRCDPQQNTAIEINGLLVGKVYHRNTEPNTGLNHINLFLYPNAPAGRWQVRLFGKKITDGRYHAWIERDGACPGCQSRFLKKYTDPSHTTGTICNGFNTIAVGAVRELQHETRMAPFSSMGPTTDGRVKPDLVAPGVRIVAARSAPRTSQQGGAGLTRMSGTSMAAPHVTGTVALMLETIRKPVEIHQIRNILLGSTDELSPTGNEKMRMGSGLLNLQNALKSVRKYNRTLGRRKSLTTGSRRFARSGKPAHV
ncbi:MAG: hypothetical protein DHS20C17_17700 [Cyclobacteriaceae bacterium]|nr:MAG: hypothetical protein DHS20C17_17700 [Cyclobacteriaceae bacterium]